MPLRNRRIFLTFLLPAAVFAGPMIDVDIPDHDIGIVYDGFEKTFSHVFKVKNTGDAPLVITSVRKTCGCTSILFDSIIPPGGTGSIKETVVIEDDASPGNFSMPITVLSDARNSPILKLSIKGSLKRLIEVEPISLLILSKPEKDTAEGVLTLRSNFQGLKVTGVNFHYTEKTQAFSFTTSIPLTYSFSLDTTRQNKPHKILNKKTDPFKNDSKYAYAYALTIKHPRGKPFSRAGDVIISTNHPERHDLKISGNIIVD